ncbi:hypothetical protein K435DRAFT_195135 [Dendrothele bispora CBS 962.96]|uniref:Uncharacterized protein n=1 Tax=Dendrothele bispora (strain CBS 962.96) TaxID=1314807 RepID=A0A4S8LV74_DENBC|nr:hypothetical protein K435DRAFT_195135 [Dendrothele bispora CBS 962.96]
MHFILIVQQYVSVCNHNLVQKNGALNNFSRFTIFVRCLWTSLFLFSLLSLYYMYNPDSKPPQKTTYLVRVRSSAKDLPKRQYFHTHSCRRHTAPINTQLSWKVHQTTRPTTKNVRFLKVC